MNYDVFRFILNTNGKNMKNAWKGKGHIIIDNIEYKTFRFTQRNQKNCNNNIFAMYRKIYLQCFSYWTEINKHCVRIYTQRG